MANLVVLLIVLGCAAYQYQKGKLVKSFATLIIAICAGAVAFGYFEILAGLIISRGSEGVFASVAPWAQPACFVLLFIVTFAVLATVSDQLTRQAADFGDLAEPVGRVVCGIVLGFILSGLLLTALALAPLPAKYPYERFDHANPNSEKPSRIFLNADGFMTGLFNIMSKGSLSAISEKKSFAMLHCDFLDQAYLNRHNIADSISLNTTTEAIQAPTKKAVWPAPDGLKDSNNRAVPRKTGYELMIVRVGIKRSEVRQAGAFTLSQLRLVCKPKGNVRNALGGRGRSVYPVGYLKTADKLQTTRLTDRIELSQGDFMGTVRWIDFAFFVPNGFVPALVEFKQNNIAQLPAPVAADQAPPAASFIQLSNCVEDVARLKPLASAEIYGVELGAGGKLLADIEFKIRDANHWHKCETTDSIEPAQFEGEAVKYVRAQMKIVEPDKPPEPEPSRRGGRRPRRPEERDKRIGKMLKPLDKYKLLSLKCNNPSTGMAIRGEQLPVLVELSAVVHHAVGIVAAGKIGDDEVYEVDYCSLTASETAGGLVIAEDGSVAQAFPATVWLPAKAQSIKAFYVLYLVKSGRGAVITEVGPADSEKRAGFKTCEGFFVK